MANFVFLLFTLCTSVSAMTISMEDRGLTQVPPGTGLNVTVTALRLSGNEITSLSSLSFSNYPNLEDIVMTGNPLTTIGEGTFDNLAFLKSVSFHYCDLTGLPSTFGQAELSLRDVRLSNNVELSGYQLQAPYFSGFSSLEVLIISASLLAEFDPVLIPPSIVTLMLDESDWTSFPNFALSLPLLESLDLSHNRIANIPQSALTALTAITTLNMNTNLLTALPDMSALSTLENLDLSYNDIVTIPDHDIIALTNLVILRLDHNDLQLMPNLSHMSLLSELYIDYNAIEVVPESSIAGLTSLTSFSMIYNNLREMPTISPLTALQYVNLTGNNIPVVTENDVVGLSSLLSLDLRENALVSITDLSCLTQLATLHLFDNNLTTIPDMINATTLTSLTAATNPLVCNQSLCWIRMWSRINVALSPVLDTLVCQLPEAAQGMVLMDVYEPNMQCYKDNRFEEFFVAYDQRHPEGLRVGYMLVEEVNYEPGFQMRSKLECASQCFSMPQCTGIQYFRHNNTCVLSL